MASRIMLASTEHPVKKRQSKPLSKSSGCVIRRSLTQRPLFIRWNAFILRSTRLALGWKPRLLRNRRLNNGYRFHDGQKLWYVDNERRRHSEDGIEVTITQIGRKWATLDIGSPAYHFAYRDKLWYRVTCNSGGLIGRVWRTKDEWEHHLLVFREVEELRKKFDWNYVPPDGMTLDRVFAAAYLLGIEL